MGGHFDHSFNKLRKMLKLKCESQKGGSYFLLNSNLFFFLPESRIESNKNRKKIDYYKLKRTHIINFLRNNEIKKTLGGRYNSELILKAVANTQCVDFEVTKKCNLNCTYCIFGMYYSRNRPNTNTNINLEYAYSLIDYLVTLFNDDKLNISRGKPIYFGFYGGEPLLNFSGIKKIISYIENKNLMFNTH